MTAGAGILADPAPWRRVVEPAAAPLLLAAAAGDSTDVRHLARLRQSFEPALVAVAVELVRARKKAAGRLAGAEQLVLDVAGVEQATSDGVAVWKAARFARAGIPRVVDLCAGVGGDARALARVARVVAVDRSPVRAWMSRRNTGSPAVAADVTTLDFGDLPFHFDPQRRDDRTRRRAAGIADYRPGPAYLERLLARAPAGAVKLGPGVDPAAVPGVGVGELEFISERGSLVQAVLWHGDLAGAPGLCSATRLPEAVHVTGAPAPLPQWDASAEPSFLYVPDPALERARLTAIVATTHGLGELHPGLGLLAGARAVSDPWLEGFGVVARLPWREGKLRQVLQSLGGGPVTVRSRGGAVDAPAASRRLATAGSGEQIVFGLRLGRERVALVVDRLRTVSPGA